MFMESGKKVHYNLLFSLTECREIYYSAVQNRSRSIKAAGFIDLTFDESEK